MKFITNNLNFSAINTLKNKLLWPLILVSIVLLVVGSIGAIFLAPYDELQGIASKIMYIHVPAAWICLMFYFATTVMSIMYLSFKNSFFSILSYVVALPGAFFNFLCIATGIIWGKLTWNTWWAWDVRLTSVLILMVFYIIFIISYLNGQKNRDTNSGFRLAAAINILGAINLPIIKFSVMMYNSLHQTSSVLRVGGPSIHSSMLWPLLVIFIGCLFGCSAFILHELQKLLLQKKISHNLIKGHP